GAADIAGIDAQARSTCFSRLDATLVMEVDIGNDRHVHLAHDFLQRLGRVFVRAGDADNIDASGFGLADLLDRRLDIRCQGIGHGLHRDRRIAADQHRADSDLAALATDNVSVSTNAHDRGLSIAVSTAVSNAKRYRKRAATAISSVT